MQMQPDELLKQIAGLIDARAKTTETVLKAEIKASEEKQGKRLDKVKNQLQGELHEIRVDLKTENKETRS